MFDKITHKLMKNIFPKQYNHIEREKYWRNLWEKNQVYKFDEQSSKTIYSVDTPPPYVSAEHLHIGHIMSYSQAEFVVRFKRMQGFNVFYPMGFDDNGLPTERFVEKKYSVDKSKINRSDFVKLCLKETKTGSQNYKNLWTKLGVSVDWTKTYSTIDPLCQRISQWSFIELYKKGKVYRKEGPMLWCPFCQTALAQADLEDREIDTSLNYINFSIDDKEHTIATTRPELIPACVGIFANPKDKRYKGLKAKKVTIPLFNYKVPVYFSKSVDPSFGTGLMMVCTWGDFGDTKKFKEFDLPVREAIDKKGKITKMGGKYKGSDIATAREKIIQDLKKQGLLIKQEKIKHTLNAHERCGTPIEFILTKQWFIDLLNIKEELLKRGEELNWYPRYMKSRYSTWIRGLKWDWCISRQRYYGVPFPLWYCKKCSEVVTAKEKKLPVDPAEKAPPVAKCPKCGSKKFIPDRDVMDTWATSSCTPFIIPELIENPQLKKKIFPNLLRPQAFEIIRTWLFYSITKSHYHFNKLPFKDAMISGHGLDEKGKKISKRLGNYIDPNKLLEKYGADAIRYWATGVTLGSNHRFNPKEIEKGKHLVNKIWNASRFYSMYIKKFKPKSKSKYRLEPEDKWILHQLNLAIEATTTFFEKYEYAKVRKALDKFFWAIFCDYYLEIIKYRANEEAAKYTLYTCLLNIFKLYAPILPFITEEVYQRLFKESERIASIHQTTWPEINKNWKLDKKNLKEMEYFIEEMDEIKKEKADRGSRFKDVLSDYSPKTKVNLDIFGNKLQKIFNVKLYY